MRARPLSDLQRKALKYGCENGPCTIFDLRRAFNNPSIEGAVFRAKHWTRIGFAVSETKRSKGSEVAVWVPTSWLASHYIHGCNYAMSAFSFDRMYVAERRRNPKFDTAIAKWIVGTCMLADKFSNKREILGIPVEYRPGCVGALLIITNKETGNEEGQRRRDARCASKGKVKGRADERAAGPDAGPSNGGSRKKARRKGARRPHHRR